MTPFMQQVADALATAASDTALETIPSTPRTVGEGLHNQVELRALAEQLVCEGNVLIREHGLVLDLVDDPGGERLAFEVSCGRARAWIVTDVIGRTATARITVSTADCHEQEIAGPEGLAALLLRLISAERAAVSTT